jgi:hypothetical protein
MGRRDYESGSGLGFGPRNSDYSYREVISIAGYLDLTAQNGNVSIRALSFPGLIKSHFRGSRTG